MTQEEKFLLLQELCARLPYGVIVQDRNGVHELSVGNTEFTDLFGGKCNIKPYLRPLSSMTEVEKMDFNEIQRYNVFYSSKGHYTEVDFLNAHHFDYRGLIPKGIAIEVTEENNPYRECL